MNYGVLHRTLDFFNLIIIYRDYSHGQFDLFKENTLNFAPPAFVASKII